MKKIIDPGFEASARNYIDLFRAGKLDLVEKDLDETVKPPNVHEVFTKMAALVPKGEPKSVKTIGYQDVRNYVNGVESRRVNVSFEYEYPGKWLLINVARRIRPDGTTIDGFNVQPIKDSLENMNKFTFDGKGALYYLVFSLAIAIPVFIIYTTVLCARTKIEKRKWLWLIFILCGLTNFSLNWTTGEWRFLPMQFELLGAGFFSVPYGPWILSVGLPVGAVVFLLRRRKLGPSPMVGGE